MQVNYDKENDGTEQLMAMKQLETIVNPLVSAVAELKGIILNKRFKKEPLKQSELAELKKQIEKLNLDVEIIRGDIAASKEVIIHSLDYICLKME